MNLSNPFKGKIYFSDPRSNSKKYLHYSFTHPDKIPLTEKFIYRFKSLKMCKNEKKKLSSHHREFLYGYKNIDINQINQFVDSLAKKIDMYQNSKISIPDDFLNNYLYNSDKLREISRKFIIDNKL